MLPNQTRSGYVQGLLLYCSPSPTRWLYTISWLAILFLPFIWIYHFLLDNAPLFSTPLDYFSWIYLSWLDTVARLPTSYTLFLEYTFSFPHDKFLHSPCWNLQSDLSPFLYYFLVRLSHFFLVLFYLFAYSKGLKKPIFALWAHSPLFKATIEIYGSKPQA